MLLIDSSVPDARALGPWLFRELGVRAVGNWCEYGMLVQDDYDELEQLASCSLTKP